MSEPLFRNDSAEAKRAQQLLDERFREEFARIPNGWNFAIDLNTLEPLTPNPKLLTTVLLHYPLVERLDLLPHRHRQHIRRIQRQQIHEIFVVDERLHVPPEVAK